MMRFIGKYTNKLYVIKNKALISELERKLKRILAWENNRPNYFRQHITDIKSYLISEIEADKSKKIKMDKEDEK